CLSLSTAARLCGTAATRRGGRQRAAFGENLHILQGLSELRGALRLISLARGIVGEWRVVVHQRVNKLRRSRSDGARLERSVIDNVRTVCPDRPRIRIRELRLSHQHFGRDGTYGAELAIFARDDRARNPQPFTDV